jgi:hypothetical protein
MKQALVLLISLSVVCASLAQAEKPKIEAVIAKDKDTKPTTTFAADVPKLCAFFRSTGTKTGDSLRAVWIAEDVGTAAAEETKIDEATLTADDDNFYGAFSLTKPTKGWPIGEYRVDIYLGNELATSTKFTIGDGESDEEAKAESKEDSPEE